MRTLQIRAYQMFPVLDAAQIESALNGCVETDGKGFAVAGAGTLPLETSLPGVFATCDARAGSTKRVAAAVGEGAAVVARIHAMITQQAAREQP